MIAGKVFALTAPWLLAVAGVAEAAPSASSGLYGGPTSPKVLGSPNWITLSVADGALGNVGVDAVVDRGAASCSIGSEPASFDFAKGTVRIEPQGKFDGTLKDPDG